MNLIKHQSNKNCFSDHYNTDILSAYKELKSVNKELKYCLVLRGVGKNKENTVQSLHFFKFF